MMLCFWFSIHKEALQEAQFLYDLDPIIAKIMKTLRERGEIDIIQKVKREEEERRKKKALNMVGDDSKEDSANGEEDEDPKGEDDPDKLPPIQLNRVVEPIIDKEDYNFQNIDDLKNIKWLLTDKEIGIAFNTNILRICLNIKEELIAKLIVAYYQVAIDEKMIQRAVKSG